MLSLLFPTLYLSANKCSQRSVGKRCPLFVSWTSLHHLDGGKPIHTPNPNLDTPALIKGSSDPRSPDTIFLVQAAFQTPESLCLVLEFCIGGELMYHMDAAGIFTEEVLK